MGSSWEWWILIRTLMANGQCNYCRETSGSRGGRRVCYLTLFTSEGQLLLWWTDTLIFYQDKLCQSCCCLMVSTCNLKDQVILGHQGPFSLREPLILAVDFFYNVCQRMKLLLAFAYGLQSGPHTSFLFHLSLPHFTSFQVGVPNLLIWYCLMQICWVGLHSRMLVGYGLQVGHEWEERTKMEVWFQKTHPCLHADFPGSWMRPHTETEAAISPTWLHVRIILSGSFFKNTIIWVSSSEIGLIDSACNLWIRIF